VFDGNFAEIPALLRFFSKNADVVGLVSFQIQAATGRGFVSMCAHNAAREAFIRKPLEVKTEDGVKAWNPLTGLTLPTVTRDEPVPRILPSVLSTIPGSSLPVLAGGK
jgi:hypothetical protein